MKSLVINTLKIAIAFGLITYLIRTDQLDFSQMGKVFSMPSLGITMFLFWIVGPLLLGSFRWRLLLHGAGYQITWPRAIRLHLIGFFFNTAMPGAVGGDLIKVLYVIRDNKHMGKTPAIMSVFLDRLIGLSGLFIVGLLVAIASYPIIQGQAALISIVITLAVVSLGILAFFAAALYEYRDRDPFDSLLSKPIPGFSPLRKIYGSLRLYRNHRTLILKCLGLSILIQLFSVLVFVLFTRAIIPDQNPQFGTIATIYPVGMFTVALPIAPGGLGVGHVAFDRLFEIIGHSQGASVFNVFLLTQMALNLLGAIPYLSLKKEEPVNEIDTAIKI
ncbi:lysylphosphatidylglycerol synthase transmembrane domain-containing protein [Pseudobacteriovorax antillogorgiicola]|uniref:Lysylphosphatidylglycerol synthase TM region n=1 Tax=Pseudobacteriovorax antillogorgiicola TaxID=1513793 RepID=A0A1Y6CIC1_9BACT|nr:lysylphosphatidylglycerol synthase transmembrane domain-containing protein [Pseudobacteriovorax antillogorgiicola]TCS46647.1 hypothetical protein EDD56_12323 [Pseudobacteriovorax antillogorgiicola]SMF66332.1 hypothetical protein SAMN06296036_12323 [Pseudobacteriovorax antillogorgiicola]